jgi:hypothetical protein
MTTHQKEWARGRDDETGPVEEKAARPKQRGNPARGKPNELKAQRPARGRQKAETGKGNRTDVGAARRGAHRDEQ